MEQHSEKTFSTVGIVGLGKIGAAFADRLLSYHWPVVGYTRTPGGKTLPDGLEMADTIAVLATRCDVIVLALSDMDACSYVVASLRAAAPSASIVNCTSLLPGATIELSDAVHDAGGTYIDAPVMGSVDLVRHGKARILAGAHPAHFEKWAKLLELLAGEARLVGPIGTASAIKGASLLMMAVNTLGAAEGLRYATAFGVDPQVALTCLKETPGASAALQFRGWRMASKDFRPEVGKLQDFRNLVAGIDASAPTPTSMLAQAVRYFDKAIAMNLGDRDAAAVFEALMSRAEDHCIMDVTLPS